MLSPILQRVGDFFALMQKIGSMSLNLSLCAVSPSANSPGATAAATCPPTQAMTYENEACISYRFFRSTDRHPALRMRDNHQSISRGGGVRSRATSSRLRDGKCSKRMSVFSRQFGWTFGCSVCRLAGDGTIFRQLRSRCNRCSLRNIQPYLLPPISGQLRIVWWRTCRWHDIFRTTDGPGGSASDLRAGNDTTDNSV